MYMSIYIYGYSYIYINICYKDDKLGQGRDTVKGIIENNPELMTDLEDQILVAKGIKEADPKKAAKEKAKEGKLELPAKPKA